MAESIGNDFRRLRDDLAARWYSFRARSQPQSHGARRNVHTPARPAIIALKWGGGLLLVAIIVFLALFDWNMLRGPVSRYASYRLHRQVRIEGNLHVHLWSWTPRIDVDGLHIANTKWAGGGDMANVGHLTISVKLVPLLGGHVRLPLVQLDKSSFVYVRNLAGHSNWEFSKTESNKPLKLPAINRFLINDGHIRIDDARKKMHFVGTVSSSESTAGRGSGFVLTGDGTLNGEKFTADVRGAPLLNVDQTNPYPFTMDVHAGYTHVTAQGQITHPFDLGDVDAQASFSGRDAAELYYLTGLVLPNTPHYEARAHIVRDGELYKADSLHGWMGHSDIAGYATVDASTDIPFVRANLHSRSVYFDDLGFLFGGGHGRKTAVAAPASTRRAAASAPSITLVGQKNGAAQSTLLLPDAPLDVERVRQMNADVRYHAASIVSHDFPLRSISVRARLNNGVLRLDPFSAGLAQGTVSGHAKLDASRRVPITFLDLRVRDIRLQQLVHPVKGQSTIEGALDARAVLTASGDTVHKAASNANGSLTFVVPHGQMRKAFAELLGINLLNGGLALLTGDQSQTNIRCAVASFQARDGVFMAQNITLDTDVERGTGRGSINLKNETVNLTLSGDAKSFRILRMNAPITINGTLSHPKVGVEASHALGQGGLAVALGALINPLASLLATIDPGLAKDANCGALIAGAKQKGAPVGHRLVRTNGGAKLQTTAASERVARRRR
jgi:uncharacterized protein involved in outer membrane biogenesis